MAAGTMPVHRYAATTPWRRKARIFHPMTSASRCILANANSWPFGGGKPEVSAISWSPHPRQLGKHAAVLVWGADRDPNPIRQAIRPHWPDNDPPLLQRVKYPAAIAYLDQ